MLSNRPLKLYAEDYLTIYGLHIHEFIYHDGQRYQLVWDCGVGHPFIHTWIAENWDEEEIRYRRLKLQGNLEKLIQSGKI